MSLSQPGQGNSGNNPFAGHMNVSGDSSQPNYLQQHFGAPPSAALQATPPQPYAPGAPDTPTATQPMQGTSTNPTGSTAVDPAQMQQMIQQLTQSQVPNGTMGIQQQQAGQVAYPSANASGVQLSGSNAHMPFGS